MDVKQEAAGPEWARGCEWCSFGIVYSPALSVNLPLSEARRAAVSDTIFCQCKAGVTYEQFLRGQVRGAKGPGDHPGAAATGDGARDGTLPDISKTQQPRGDGSFDSFIKRQGAAWSAT